MSINTYNHGLRQRDEPREAGHPQLQAANGDETAGQLMTSYRGVVQKGLVSMAIPGS